MNALIKNTVLIFTVTLAFMLLCSFSSNNPDKKWVIVIDPGHGGRDPGAVGPNRVQEKSINLAVALKTGEYIEKNLENVSVVYTRKTDVFVELRERAAIANRNNADLFISIHTNSAPGASARSAQGTETYVMGLASDRASLEAAMRENSVILLESDYTTKYENFDPKSPESYIMFTLMHNVYQQQSINLAAKIQEQFRNRVNRVDRGVKQAGYLVLYMTTMPSILTELGFISNPAEERYLNSTQGQDYLASAIFRACRDYINEIDRRSGISAVRTEGGNSASAGNPITNDITFMVQIASSATRREMKPENFNGIGNLHEIVENNRFKYASGRFATYQEAVEYRKEIEKKIRDAFVIAVKDNKTIPLQQAIEQTRK